MNKVRIPKKIGAETVLAKDRYGNKLFLCGNGRNECDFMTDGRVLPDWRLSAELAQKFSVIAARLKGDF